MFKRSKTAAVLGCGPAGLFAAHAFIEAGWDVDIYSNKRRSEMFGAQYLHEPIPGLHAVETTIRYVYRGDAESYARKVYGDVKVDSVSFQQFPERQTVWDIRGAYYDAWNRYADRIIHTPGMSAMDVEDLLETNNTYRWVVSSLPVPDLCQGVHRFANQKIWALGDAPERGIFCPIQPDADSVWYDGTKNVGWYRASNAFGYNTCEWPYGGPKPPITDIATVVKPVKTDCDCLSGKYKRFIRVGRYGTWTKGVLSHEAYTTVKGLLS